MPGGVVVRVDRDVDLKVLARVLAGEPRWILADEPFASLDPAHQLDAAADPGRQRGVQVVEIDRLRDVRVHAGGAQIQLRRNAFRAQALHEVVPHLLVQGPEAELRRRGRGSPVADAAGQWTLRPTVALANGLRTFTASVRDVAGNASPLSAAVSLSVDSYPPDSPLIETAGTFNLATPPIAGRAEPLGSVRLFAGAALLGTAPVLADGRWTFTPATPLAEGQHALAAVAMAQTEDTLAAEWTEKLASRLLDGQITDGAARGLWGPMCVNPRLFAILMRDYLASEAELAAAASLTLVSVWRSRRIAAR